MFEDANFKPIVVVNKGNDAVDNLVKRFTLVNLVLVTVVLTMYVTNLKDQLTQKKSKGA